MDPYGGFEYLPMKRAYILLINWNGCEDTIECLESVMRLQGVRFRVVVCDNCSGDGSLERIRAWAEGRLDSFASKSNHLRELSFPPTMKPIPYVEYTRQEAETGGNLHEDSARLILVNNELNL